MKTGAQLFTVREFCKTTEDFAETLKKVADIGYTTVQVSGTCEYDPQWLDQELKKNGLRCVVTHIPADRLLRNISQVVADHNVFGCDNVGLGCYGFKPEQDLDSRVSVFVRDFTPVSEGLKNGGKYFMYHNHDQEFIIHRGKPIIEHLSELIPADLMGFTLDTYWIQTAGGDPAYWIERFSGRTPCIHLKDHGYGHRMEAVGSGNINFDRVFEKAEASGTEYMLVEQDNCNGEDPFSCLKKSYEFLKSRGFE